MGNHDEDYFNDEDFEATEADEESSGDDDASDSSESTADDGGEGGSEAGEPDDAAEDGFDVETHGAGELETVSGFGSEHAMLEGIGEETDIPIDQELWTLPRSCDLEYENEPQESVCGRDNRIQITATTRIPWRMICQLIITRRDGRKVRCTGWFISPRTVMTAGHCVYSHSGQRGWARSIEVIPGMNGRSRPFGSAVGTSFRSVKGWTKGRKPSHDYGCIILPRNAALGRRTGWWGFARLSSASLRRLLVNNCGYAGDKPFGTQWYNAGRITRVTKRRLYYMLDTAGGHSGCPTWRYRRGKRHVVGIHAYGGCPNKSTRISKPVFNNMKRWKQLGA